MRRTGSNGTVVNSVVHFNNEDPGYKGTAHILAECIMCLIKEKEGVIQEGGFWTPSICCGNVQKDRLVKTGGNIRFYSMEKKVKVE